MGRRVGDSHWETLRDSERQRPVLRRGRQFRPAECSPCMRTAEAISGRERQTGCGDGSLVLRSSIRCQTGAEIRALIEGDNGELLIAMRGGIRQLVDGKARGVSASRRRAAVQPQSGCSGIAMAVCGSERTDQGLLHVHQGRTDLFARSDGLSGDSVYSLFEDREGNIWVATDRRPRPFSRLRRPHDFCETRFVDRHRLVCPGGRDGSVWLGTRDGLNRWKNGQVTIYRKRSSGLPDDAVESLFQDDHGRIWVSTLAGLPTSRMAGLFPLALCPADTCIPSPETARGISGFRPGSGSFSFASGECRRTDPLGQAGTQGLRLRSAPRSCAGRPVAWVLSGWRGVFQGRSGPRIVRERRWVGRGPCHGLQLDRDGTLWAATEGGLSRVKDGRVATLTSKNGLPCDTVHWVMEDDDHSFWLYMACGLVRIARPELDAWVTDPKRTIQTTVFDSSDGVRSHADTVAATARESPSPRMENCGSCLATASASSIRVIFPSTNSRRRYTSSKSSPTARPTMHLRTCACPR